MKVTFIPQLFCTKDPMAHVLFTYRPLLFLKGLFSLELNLPFYISFLIII
jgi:hypothetical protein